MTINDFKDMLFDLLNNNDDHIKDINTDDLNNSFTITTKSNDCFAIKICNIPFQQDLKEACPGKEIQEYNISQSREDFINEFYQLLLSNPLLYMIILSIFRLMSLEIISEQAAEELLQKLEPYRDQLKKEYDKPNIPLAE